MIWLGHGFITCICLMISLMISSATFRSPRLDPTKLLGSQITIERRLITPQTSKNGIVVGCIGIVSTMGEFHIVYHKWPLELHRAVSSKKHLTSLMSLWLSSRDQVQKRQFSLPRLRLPWFFSSRERYRQSHPFKAHLRSLDTDARGDTLIPSKMVDLSIATLLFHQTWLENGPWKKVVFLVINIHLVRGFSSQPCLMKPEGKPPSSHGFPIQNCDFP